MRFSITCAAALAVAQTSLAAVIQNRQSSDKVGYFFVNFPVWDETVHMHLSDGNNPLAYRQLSYDGTINSTRILPNTLGTKGVRDPFVVSARDNSKYWLHGTDLNVNSLGGDFIGGTRFGSRSMVIWESDDLATWSAPRLSAPLVNASAGNVWAPESFWDPQQDKFMVIFASRFWNPADKDRRGPTPPNVLMYVTTTDFNTFSEAKTYFNPGFPVIDVTFLHMPEEGKNVWYRWVKSEVDYKIWQQKSTTGIRGKWTNVGGAPDSARVEFAGKYANNEGQLIFRDNLDPGLFHLWIDQSSTETYIPAQARTLNDMNAWKLSDTSRFTKDTKHGHIVPVNQKQYDAIAKKYKFVK